MDFVFLEGYECHVGKAAPEFPEYRTDLGFLTGLGLLYGGLWLALRMLE
jgi:hypothetical protein